jgi:hypothetical protein
MTINHFGLNLFLLNFKSDVKYPQFAMLCKLKK